MKDGFFGLIRYYLRIDGIIIRIYDTRLYHSFNTNFIIREFLVFFITKNIRKKKITTKILKQKISSLHLIGFKMMINHFKYPNLFSRNKYIEILLFSNNDFKLNFSYMSFINNK